MLAMPTEPQSKGQRIFGHDIACWIQQGISLI